MTRNPHPTEAEIRDVLSGHLCRCTGYADIVKAIKEVVEGDATARLIRHPEVAAKRPSKDTARAPRPASFEARRARTSG